MPPRTTSPTVVRQPRPLTSCPGLRHWRPHSGTTYLVFVDESFDGFFEFRPRGYFVHAAVGIPESRYDTLKRSASVLLAEYRSLTSPGQAEFKSGVFRTIPHRQRRTLASSFARLLATHGGFVAGFYTPVRSYVLERVRGNILDEAIELPDALGALFDDAQTELLSEMNGPGQAGAVAKLLQLPVGAVANMLAALGCDFHIVYDPRHPREDAAVSVEVAAYLKLHESFKDVESDIPADVAERFLSFRFDRTSEQEVGLQFADLIAGEVRQFFRSYPDLLTVGASRSLITPLSREPVITAARVNGRLFKTGALHRMRAAHRRAFTTADHSERSVLDVFAELLAAGILTCYSSEGQPRDLMPFEGLIWDQCE